MNLEMIVVHCSDSPQGRGDNAETIHRWHQEKDYDGVGYHWVILEDGTIQAGRPEYWQGAHVRGHNKTSLGICLIGVDEFPREQLMALRGLCIAAMDRHPKIYKVVGHCDLDPKKTCPNFDVTDWWATGE